jgi:hypothetical protein
MLALPTTLAMFLTLALAPAAMADHKPGHQAPKNVTHRHFLKMYKVEKYITIPEPTAGVLHGTVPPADANEDTHVFCDTNDPNNFTDNDLATDGMWKVVDVDQDTNNTRPFEELKVYASYRDHVPTVNYPGGDPSKWHFEFDNRTDSAVQIKMFVTCLGWKTEPNSHRHQWTWSGVHHQNVVGNFGVYSRQDADSAGDDCPSGTIAVSPGFQFDRTMGVGDIYRSRYRLNNYRGWSWGFWVEPGPFDLDLTFHCLDIPTQPAGNPNHIHDLVFDFEPGAFFPAIPNTNIAGDPDGAGPQRSVETRVRNCDSHEKGMVHSFDLDVGNLHAGHFLWFLGMDPRIKSRAYKILNTSTLAQDAQFGLMCFNDRTGRRKKP